MYAKFPIETRKVLILFYPYNSQMVIETPLVMSPVSKIGSFNDILYIFLYYQYILQFK